MLVSNQQYHVAACDKVYWRSRQLPFLTPKDVSVKFVIKNNDYCGLLKIKAIQFVIKNNDYCYLESKQF